MRRASTVGGRETLARVSRVSFQVKQLSRAHRERAQRARARLIAVRFAMYFVLRVTEIGATSRC